MKIVVVELQADGPDGIAVGVAVVQKRASSGWSTIKTHPLKSNDPSTKRTLLLDEDERLVVEGISNTKYTLKDGSLVKSVGGEPPIPQFSEAALAVTPGPLPEGTESQIGVWRVADEQDWSRTGAKYRIY